MNNVVSFSPSRPGSKTFLVDRFIPEGRKRRQWAVIIREPNGNEGYHLVRSEKDAIWLADILRKAEASRQAEINTMAQHPLGNAILRLSPETRDLLRQMLGYEDRLRGVAD